MWAECLFTWSGNYRNCQPKPNSVWMVSIKLFWILGTNFKWRCYLQVSKQRSHNFFQQKLYNIQKVFNCSCFRLGTLKPQNFVLKMNPVRRIYDPRALPRDFSSEETWPGYIRGIQDQLWCGSSWAISTAAVASDRSVQYLNSFFSWCKTNHF